MPAVMVQLHGLNHTNLARIVSNHITKGASFQVWGQVPVTAPDTAKYEEAEEGSDDKNSTDTWDWWNRFRLVANSNSKINLCLGIVENIPTETQIMRWVGEPMKTVSIPTSMFLTNKKGYPVLSKPDICCKLNWISGRIQVAEKRRISNQFFICFLHF